MDAYANFFFFYLQDKIISLPGSEKKEKILCCKELFLVIL